MARLDRVRGYTIPGPGLASYLVGIFPQWGPNVIGESIFLVRQGERARQYVIFNTTEPIRIAGVGGARHRTQDGRWVYETENIGRPADSSSALMSGGAGYKGFALTIEEASRLGLYSASVAQSIEPSEAKLADERRRGRVGREYIKREAEKDKWRNERLLLDDLSEGLGSVSAGIVNVTGRLFGKTVAGFVGSLGPYGVLALTIAAGAATAYYVVPLVKAANRGK
tara:strand:- start:8041 stop:8715 length:675 start_codon:yes stop_codon:yes gene_type:complete